MFSWCVVECTIRSLWRCALVLKPRQLSGEGWSQSAGLPSLTLLEFLQLPHLPLTLTELAWWTLPPRWHLRVLREATPQQRHGLSSLRAIQGSNILKLHLCDLGFWIRMSNDPRCMIAVPERACDWQRVLRFSSCYWKHIFRSFSQREDHRDCRLMRSITASIGPSCTSSHAHTKLSLSKWLSLIHSGSLL